MIIKTKKNNKHCRHLVGVQSWTFKVKIPFQTSVLLCIHRAMMEVMIRKSCVEQVKGAEVGELAHNHHLR